MPMPKKKLPTTVRVMGFDVAVSSPNEVLQERNSYGRSNWEKQTLQIANDQTLERQQEVFLHELLHTTSSAGLTNDDQLSERQVNAVAVVLHQIFRDNPAVLEFLR